MPDLSRYQTFMALGGDIIGQEQCQKLQGYIMSMDTANNLGGLFELTTARDPS